MIGNGRQAKRGTIFLDVTELVALDLRTGIQRVVREFLRHGMTGAGAKVTNRAVVPVMAVGDGFHALSQAGHARLDAPGTGAGAKRITHEQALSPLARFAKRAARANATLYNWLQRLHLRRVLRRLRPLYDPHPVHPGAGDSVCLIDSFWGGAPTLRAAAKAKRAGAGIVLFVHDLIPLSHPQFVDAMLVPKFRALMRRAVALCPLVLANSGATAAAFEAQFPGTRAQAVPLGFDLPGKTSAPVPGVSRPGFAWPDGLWTEQSEPGEGRVFVIVGSIEPRKGHDIVLDAFERRWREGSSDRLLIVGKVGWSVGDLMQRIEGHSQLGRRLFTVHDAGDGELAQAFARADAGIVASVVEGFGLPLVEGLSARLPMIASDIPVFREIAGGAALYFTPGDPASLSAAMDTLLADLTERRVAAAAFTWPDWREAACIFYAQIETLSAP